jgi:hypothetical protein
MKKDIKIEIILNEEDEKNYEIIKNEILKVTDKHNISLILEFNISSTISSRILYFTKAENNEFISEKYLNFLDELIDCLQVIENKYKIIHLPAN